jgi:hypothetical protein
MVLAFGLVAVTLQPASTAASTAALVAPVPDAVPAGESARPQRAVVSSATVAALSPALPCLFAAEAGAHAGASAPAVGRRGDSILAGY